MIFALGVGTSSARYLHLQPAEHPARVALEDLRPVRVAQGARVDIALRVVEVVPGLGVDAAHRAHHLRGEQEVVGRDDFEQQVDAGLVVDAGVEPDVVQYQIGERRLAHHVGQAPEAAPVVGDRAAAVRDDEPDGREVPEQVGGDHLHHRRGVRPEVVGAGGVEGGVAGGADVDHRGHVELHHLLVEGIPPAVAQGRVGPVAAARVRVQVAADEAELVDTTFQLPDAGGGRHAGGLRKLGDAGEILGVEPGDPVDEVVAVLGPGDAGGFVAEVVAHPARTRREDGEIRATLALQPELRAFQALADLVVGDVEPALDVPVQGVLFELRLLPLPVPPQRIGGGGVVAVAVDDHGVSPSLWST